MLGTTTRDALAVLDRDPATEAIVIVGEIGGTMEEDAAEYAKTMRKRLRPSSPAPLRRPARRWATRAPS
jgi:succinyl-CoA synthetase alpha subunit